jgi:C4-dicarboxylate-binding protein DctP
VKQETKVGKWLIGLVLAALLMGLGPGGVASAAEKKIIKLKIGSGHPVAADWIKITSDFFCRQAEKRVGERTSYKLEFSEHWGGSVAKLGEELEAVEIGLLDMAAIITPFEPTKLYLQNYGFNIPFNTSDTRISARVNTRLYKEFPALKAILRKYNQMYLTSGALDDYGLISKFPIRSAADIKGKKICAAGPNLPWISGVGAVPVQGNLNEAYTGLQTGVYDGWVMYANGVVSFKLHEVAHYFIEMNFGCPADSPIISINLNAWQKLPKEVQVIFEEVAGEFPAVQAENTVELHKKSMKVLKDSGTHIYQMPFAEKVKWAGSLVNQPKKFAQEADSKGWPGTPLMKAAIKYAEEEGHAFPRKWMEE